MDPFRELHAVARIGFLDEVIPAPAVAARAERQVDETAKRQQVVADEEVLEAQYVGSRPERRKAAPEVEAQYAGQREQDDDEDTPADDDLAVLAQKLQETADEVLKDGDDRGHGRERHEQEEQCAPEMTEGHMVEDIRQGHEQEVRTAARVNAIAKAGGENDEAGHDGDKRVEDDDPDGLARQTLRLADIAAEDGQGADAEAQREERLPHGRKDDFLYAVFHDLVEIRIQIILEANLAVRQHDGIDDEHGHQQEQAEHHPLRDALDAGLNAEVADAAAEQHDENHAAGHRDGVGQEAAEDGTDAVSIEPVKGPRRHLVKIVEHPAGNRRVEHHEQQIARDGPVLVPVPFRPLRFQHIEGHRGTAHARAADGELRDHDGQAEDGQEYQINQNE